MLDHNTINIHSSSNGIYRSHPKSKFISCEPGNIIYIKLFEFNEDCTIYFEGKHQQVVVLQAVQFNNKVIVEVMSKADFDEVIAKMAV